MNWVLSIKSWKCNVLFVNFVLFFMLQAQHFVRQNKPGMLTRAFSAFMVLWKKIPVHLGTFFIFEQCYRNFLRILSFSHFFTLQNLVVVWIIFLAIWMHIVITRMVPMSACVIMDMLEMVPIVVSFLIYKAYKLLTDFILNILWNTLTFK